MNQEIYYREMGVKRPLNQKRNMKEPVKAPPDIIDLVKQQSIKPENVKNVDSN